MDANSLFEQLFADEIDSVPYIFALLHAFMYAFIKY